MHVVFDGALILGLAAVLVVNHALLTRKSCLYPDTPTRIVLAGGRDVGAMFNYEASATAMVLNRRRDAICRFDSGLGLLAWGLRGGSVVPTWFVSTGTSWAGRCPASTPAAGTAITRRADSSAIQSQRIRRIQRVIPREGIRLVGQHQEWIDAEELVRCGVVVTVHCR